LITVLKYIPGFKDIDWIYHPEDWLGIHKVAMQFLEIGITPLLILLSLVLFLLSDEMERSESS